MKHQRINEHQAKCIAKAAAFLTKMRDDGYSDEEIAEVLFGTVVGLTMRTHGLAFTVVVLGRTARDLMKAATAKTQTNPFEPPAGHC